MTTRREWWWRAGAGFALLMASCSTGKEECLRVEGLITVNGQPLLSGTIVFHPDASKGNTSKREPRGTIVRGKPGRYRLTTDGQDGAPPGWYQVTVFALQPITRENSQRPPEWLADPKYADLKTSGLAVMVNKDARSGAYDFDLQSPPRR
jgi:hypothetical protein